MIACGDRWQALFVTQTLLAMAAHTETRFMVAIPPHDPHHPQLHPQPYAADGAGDTQQPNPDAHAVVDGGFDIPSVQFSFQGQLNIAMSSFEVNPFHLHFFSKIF